MHIIYHEGRALTLLSGRMLWVVYMGNKDIAFPCPTLKLHESLDVCLAIVIFHQWDGDNLKDPRFVDPMGKMGVYAGVKFVLPTWRYVSPLRRHKRHSLLPFFLYYFAI